jgi:hypothetical protein
VEGVDPPDDVKERLDLATAGEIAAVYGDEAVFPSVVAIHDERSDRFPGWHGSVLLISTENQGVCSWGVSLDGPDIGAIVVGLEGRTVVHTPTLAEFITARRWDRLCLSREPLLQAQAHPLDTGSLAYLTGEFDQGTTTYGWPCEVNYRFQAADVRVMLWACAEQCDWWISGPEPDMAALLPSLRTLSNLAESLWANDKKGGALLRTG